MPFFSEQVGNLLDVNVKNEVLDEPVFLQSGQMCPPAETICFWQEVPILT